MAVVDEASISLGVESGSLAAEVKAEVDAALREATAGAGGTVKFEAEVDDARARQRIRQFEQYVNQFRNRQREQDRRYFLQLNQRLNTMFSRIKLRLTQLKAQLASLRNVKLRVELDDDAIAEQLAALSRDRRLELEVKLDLGKAVEEIERFRRAQEARAIELRVDVDDAALKRYTRTLGDATTGTTGLSRATDALSGDLRDGEAAAARAATLEERLADLRAKSEAATLKRSAAEEGLERATAQHERTGAALEQAERRIAELRTQTVKSTKELEQAEAEAAKARETHSKATEAYFTAESKATTARNGAERATRSLATAERDHESALARLRDVEERSDTAGERRVGLFGRIGGALGDLGRGFSNLLPSLSSTGEGFSGLGSSAGGAGTALLSIGTKVAGLGAQMSALGAIAGAVTFAVGGLTAAVVAAPAAITGLAAAVGVAALAFDGFGDAIKEANTPEELKKQQEALAKLHPEAQKVARIFNSELRPAFDGFQKQIQGRFFQGLDAPFKALVQTINGALKPGLLRVTDSVNAFVKQLLGIVTGEQGIKRVNNALASAKSFLDQLLPAVGNLVQSFLNLAGVEPIARAIGGAFGDILNQVSAFFDEMSRSPEAVAAVEALRGVVSNLTGVFLDVLKSAMNFFTQAAPGFNNLVSAVGGLATSLINDLGGAFNTALQAAADFIKNIPPASVDAFKEGVKRLADSFQAFANSPAPGQIVDGITKIIDTFRGFVDFVSSVSSTISTVEGAINDLGHAIDEAIPPIGAVSRATTNAEFSFGSMGGAADYASLQVGEGAKKIGAAAPVAAAGANAIVNGVVTPISTLPGLTQQQFDQLPKIVQLQLQSASQAAQTGAAPIPYGIQGPMSQVPGITQAEFAKLKPEIQKQLQDAANAAKAGAAMVPPAVADPLAKIPDQAKAGLAPLPGEVKAPIDKAGEAAKAGSTLVVANVDFGPIVDKAREVFGQVPTVISQGIEKAVTATQQGGRRIVAALNLDGLREAARRGADAIPVAIETAMAQAENEAKTGTQRVITAANFAGIATSAETELAKIPVSVQTHLTAAVTTATTLGQQLQQFWAALMQSMVQLTEQGWQQMLQTEQQGAQQSVTLVQALAQQINQIFAQLAAALYTAGYNMMIRLAQGINAGGQQAIQAAQNVANAIQGLFPMSPPKWGPLSGEGDPLKSGGRIMSRVAEGIEANSAQVTAALAPALNAIAGSLDNATPGQRAAAVSASNPAAATRVANARTLPAADTGASSSGPSAADIEAATYAGTARALGEAKVQMAGGFIEYVTAGQRRDDRRRGVKRGR